MKKQYILAVDFFSVLSFESDILLCIDGNFNFYNPKINNNCLTYSNIENYSSTKEGFDYDLIVLGEKVDTVFYSSKKIIQDEFGCSELDMLSSEAIFDFDINNLEEDIISLKKIITNYFYNRKDVYLTFNINENSIYSEQIISLGFNRSNSNTIFQTIKNMILNIEKEKLPQSIKVSFINEEFTKEEADKTIKNDHKILFINKNDEIDILKEHTCALPDNMIKQQILELNNLDLDDEIPF